MAIPLLYHGATYAKLKAGVLKLGVHFTKHELLTTVNTEMRYSVV
jgi:hypothetical protein